MARPKIYNIDDGILSANHNERYRTNCIYHFQPCERASKDFVARVLWYKKATSNLRWRSILGVIDSPSTIYTFR